MQRKWRPTRKYWEAYTALHSDDLIDPATLVAPPPIKTSPRNPRKAEERREQIVAASWMKKMRIPHHHSPNGGRRDEREGAFFKAMGTSAGFPDFFIPLMRRGFGALFIEMKAANGGKLSENQLIWREILLKQGYDWYVANGAQECIEIVKNYLSGMET